MKTATGSEKSAKLESLHMEERRLFAPSPYIRAARAVAGERLVTKIELGAMKKAGRCDLFKLNSGKN